MTPLHPLAAAAAGAVFGLAALTAPNTISTPGFGALPPACTTQCTGSVPTLPAIGAVLPADQMHRITLPGRYGLAEPPQGHQYAIVGGHLVRISISDARILSVLRPVPTILD